MAEDFERIVAVSGLAGLYKVAANRHNGLIIEDLNSGARRFAPSRSHQFSLLASIGIYTYTDTEELAKVLQRIRQSGLALPEPDAVDKEVREWFRAILPEHDEDRVRLSDIRKVARWYQILEARGLLPVPEASTEEESTPAE